MLVTETKAGRIVITDIRDIASSRQYINKESPSVTKPVKKLWAKQREAVDIEMAEKIVKAGGIPQELLDRWRDLTFLFVWGEMTEAWTKGIRVAGDRIATKVNRIQRKQFDFNSTMQRIKDWIDHHGGRLIANLTAGQYTTMYALIQQQITWGVTSPYIMAQRIKPIVGLTVREGMAVGRFMATMIEEGVPANVLKTQVDRYAQYLHNNRAMRIARTEISDAYHQGQLNSVLQARDEGWLSGDPEKEWIAGGDNPCEDCLENEGAGPIPIDQPFPSGHAAPTAHPNCKCDMGYSVRR